VEITLDKRSPVPLYYQLAEAIKEHIGAGTLPPHARIPPERELSEQTGISRMTTRQAIAYLVRDGTLVRRPGIGTFVAEPKLTHDALHLLGFTEEWQQRGSAVRSEVLEQQVVYPSAGVCAGLGMDNAALATRIVRLRTSGDMPLVLETIYVPQTLCPGLEHAALANTSLYALMEGHYGLRLARAQQTFEAVGANDYESTLFGIAPGSALILLEGVTFVEDGTPAEYFKAVYRGDRIKFELESHRTAPARELVMPRVSLRIV
jgi:GntR family transcriptional regulator